MTPSRLALLVTLPALAGCGVGLPPLDPASSVGDDIATRALSPDAVVEPTLASHVLGGALAAVPRVPRVDEFEVRPLALPLGGGPALVTWSARDVANCAVVVDGEAAVRGVQGELMIDVTEDADVRLVCLDESQGLVAEERATITVVQPPVDSFRPDEEATLATWEVTSLSGRAGQEGDVHEVRLTLEQDGRLVVDVQATPARAQFELWLAADANGDGRLASEEVLQVARSSAGDRIDQVLPAGDYSLFVVDVSGAATWEISATVVDPDADGNAH